MSKRAITKGGQITSATAELEVAARQKALELAEIQRRLEEARAIERRSLIERLRGQIQESGFDYDVIVQALARRRRKDAPSAVATARRRWQHKADPACTYSGKGQLPRCVMEYMRTLGFDPKSRNDRRQFFDQYMERLE